MAKRRKARRISTRSRSYFTKRKTRRKSRSSKLDLFQMDAMIYGAVRSPISNYTANLMQNLPVIGGVAGDLTDEVAMGAINYLVAKNLKGMPRRVALKGLIIENARIGEFAAQTLLGSGTVGTAVKSVIYG